LKRAFAISKLATFRWKSDPSCPSDKGPRSYLHKSPWEKPWTGFVSGLVASALRTSRNDHAVLDSRDSRCFGIEAELTTISPFQR